VIARLAAFFRPHHTPRHSLDDILDRLWVTYLHDRATYRRSMGWA
jgi:hypothetical protein